MPRLNPFPVRITDSAGRPITGAKAYFYLTGTTTDAAVYSDSALTTTRTQPVVALAGGLLLPIYLDPDVTYDVKYTDADGVLIDFAAAISGATGSTIPVDSETPSTYAVIAGDRGRLKRRSYAGSMSDTLPAANASDIGNGFIVYIRNDSATYSDTVSVSGGGTIDGLSSLVIAPGQQRTFHSTGSAWITDPASLATGKRFLPISAAFLIPATTAGCSTLAPAETATNLVNYLHLAFSNSSTQFACQIITLPPSYNGGAFEWRAVWTAAAGTAGQTAFMYMQSQMLADDAALDSAWGAISEVGDALHAVGDVHITDWTSATPANAAAGVPMAFRFARDSANGTLAQPIRLIELHFRPILSLPNDA